MAVTIPIVTEFSGKGIDRAIKEFKQLEGAGAKAGFLVKKAFLPATAAIGGLAVVLGDATKAAMEDAAAQDQLALTLRNVTAASDAQIAAVEKSITAMSMASGIADDQLRPAFEALTRGTKDIGISTRDMSLVMDIATATQRPLVEVADALAKAYQGNTKGLRSLTPEMAALIKEGASMDQIMQVLGGTFGGATKVFAETAQGGFARLTVAINETKESIGAALLPIVEKALPRLNQFAQWASQNPDVFIKMAAAVGVVSASVIALNIALNVNPIVLFTTYTIAATAALAGLRKQFSGMPQIVQNVITQLTRLLSPLLAIVDAYNAIAERTGLPQISPKSISMPSLPSAPPTLGPPAAVTGGANRLYLGGGLAIPAAAVPALAVGGGGGGGGGGSRAIAAPSGLSGLTTMTPAAIAAGNAAADFFSAGLDNPRVRQEITVNVNGGLATSAEIGEAVVNSIRQYNQVQGPAPIAVAV